VTRSLAVFGRRLEGEPGRRGDRGERLASEPQGGDAVEIRGVRDLGSRVALEGEERVVAVHPAAVVRDLDELAAARDQTDPHVPGPCVEGVFDQLLHDRGGPLHDLACGDLVDEGVREKVDPSHAPKVHEPGAGWKASPGGA